MSRALFRPEAVAAQRGSWLGSVSLLPPPSLWWWALTALAAAAMVVAFLVLGEYTRRARVNGALVPDLGLSVVLAPVSGFVSQVLPEEGAQVQAGDALVRLSTPRSSGDGADSWSEIRAGLAQREHSLQRTVQALQQTHAQRERGLRAQLQQSALELEQMDAEIQTRQQAVALARDKVERFSSIAAERHVSAVQLREQELSMLQLLQAQQALQRQRTSLGREQLRLQQELAELPAAHSAALAQLGAERAQLKVQGIEQDVRGEQLLHAAVSGLVAQRLVQPGQAVREGDPLLILLPEGSRLQAQLEVPGTAIGFIAPGDRVLLRYQAFPYQKFGHQQGQVLRIARSSQLENGSGSGSGGRAEHYRVLVALEQQSMPAYGREEPLRPGMRVEADILAERRKLYEWLFEPLIGLVRG